MSLKISFFTLRFCLRAFTDKGVNNGLHIWLLIKLEDSVNLFDLESADQNLPQKNVVYNNILFWVKAGSKIFLRRFPVHTPILYQRKIIGTSKEPVCLCTGKQNSIPSHKVPLVFCHQFRKTILVSILLNSGNIRETWITRIVQPIVILTQQIIVRHCQWLNGVLI